MYLLRKNYVLLVLLSVVFLFGACQPAIRSNLPELTEQAKTFKTVAVLPPEIEISELTAGGVKEKRDEWCRQGEKNVKKALIEAMKDKGIKIKYVKINKKNKKDIRDIRALYKAVASSFYTHTIMYQGNVNIFPERIKNFDYSIGSVEKLLKKEKADGLLIMFGGDEISTGGRKAIQIIKAINPFDQMDHGGVTSLVVGLTDKTGAVLWYSYWFNAGQYDLRDPNSAQTFVAGVFKDYPGGNK